MKPDVRHIEEAALNAWAALQTLVYDGWLLRFGNGYTKRANSVVPLYPGTRPLEEKIAYCEKVYQQQKQLAVMDEQNLACGLGVYDRGYVGLFDMVTDPAHRQQGYGTDVVCSLLAWGQKSHKADYAYLQVMVNNAPAIRLYGEFGFEECYRYWYRVKP